MRRRMELVRDFLGHRLSGVHLDARKDLLYCDEGTAAWHGTRVVLMRTYDVLLGLLDPLCPDLVSEMRAARPVEQVRAMPSDPEWLRQVEPLQQLASHAARMVREAGLKPQDAVLRLTGDHDVLRDLFGPYDLARFLKVDRVETSDHDHVTETTEAECPRCRLHAARAAGAFCRRCEGYMPEA
jgi:predicted nucleic acid-binding protein